MMYAKKRLKLKKYIFMHRLLISLQIPYPVLKSDGIHILWNFLWVDIILSQLRLIRTVLIKGRG